VCIDLAADAADLCAFLDNNDADQLADTLNDCGDDYLTHFNCQTTNLMVTGVNGMCDFLARTSPLLHPDSSTATATGFQRLRHCLMYFVRCLCPLSTAFATFLLESGFFVNLIEPRLTTDVSDPLLSLNSLRIARHLWLFQIENNALALSDLWPFLLVLPLLPGAFALEMGRLFRDLASFTVSEDVILPFEPILGRLFAILRIVPNGEAINPVSATVRKLIEKAHCPPPVVAVHTFFGELLSQIPAPPVDGKPRNRAELVGLILDLARSVGLEDRLAVLRAISPLLYAFLLVECSAETAAAGLTLATLRLAADDEDVNAFYELAPLVNEKWHFSDFAAPDSLTRGWLIFCHALLLRIGSPVVSLFLELDMVRAFSRFIDSDLESQAYAVHLISQMIAASCDPETRTRVVDAILSDGGAIDALMEIWSDEEAYTVPEFGVQVSVADSAQYILNALEEWP
jgi:hypothetical protein